MKPGQTQYQRIMACVDPDPENTNPQRQALDEKVLQLAVSLAKRESAKLHIVHAWVLFGEQVLLKRSSRESIDQWLMETEEAHHGELSELMGRIDTSEIECETHLVKGMPRDVLPSFAASHEVDLMVMGTVCRTGLAGFLIGNTAEVVLRQVTCSVLAVKPDGFLSPVSL
jgi:nucleotide-binding universal stress UspA family protein